MAEPYMHNSHCSYASNWQGQATYVDLFGSLEPANRLWPYLGGIRSKALLPNEAPQKGNLCCTKDALRCI